ncbi:hypothetical protein VUR80DRAFT_1044 [Thermomyces stellatus]
MSGPAFCLHSVTENFSHAGIAFLEAGWLWWGGSLSRHRIVVVNSDLGIGVRHVSHQQIESSRSLHVGCAVRPSPMVVSPMREDQETSNRPLTVIGPLSSHRQNRAPRSR